ncbi:hypothetical protein ACFSUK_34585 [Sphingobium scionense]|uniref:Uncharacterized protein n=1 Tax=Sphingobium scionense TaxID=1404341 RepID=A0A7W6PUF3_9SPHN|nr:hypothetical protein [Sphingobium scionense]MBB4147029.1 hypothetical protein [Sphingobium scionense]
MKAVGMKNERQYTVEMISAFLAGTGGKWDWDDFTSCPLHDAQMESIRRRALAVDLPLDEEGAAVLRSLLAEADAAHGV